MRCMCACVSMHLSERDGACAGRLEALRQANPGKSLGDLAMVAWLNRIDLSAHGYYKVRRT
jgi:hypothetical protein